MTQKAAETALLRHAGVLKPLLGQSGGLSLLIGKDLSNVKWLIGIGGTLTRLPGGKGILAKMRRKEQARELLPGMEAVPLLDESYILASAGVLSLHYPQAALKLMQKSLK